MSADLLREAAALMRERATTATAFTDARSGAPLAWVNGLSGEVFDFGATQVAQASDHGTSRHIASWHPAVALAVADWLDDAADAFADDKRSYEDERSRGKYPYWSPRVSEPALAVARAYLGRDA